jgi:hypothetical protein
LRRKTLASQLCVRIGFKAVNYKIEIFDAHGNPNDNYMGFVKAHIEWAMKTENQPFKREINTQEKARKYLDKYLP